MKTWLSQRAAELKPSATLAISAKEKELKSQGIDVVGFGAGEPDFPTPVDIRAAAKLSLDRGETFYTPVAGIPALKKAVCDRMSSDYGINYKPENIVVSCGAKHSIYNTLQALIGPGDEVIIFSPYWVSYPEMIALAGGKAIIVPTSEENRFLPDPNTIGDYVTSATKAILINSPSNPTGMIYSPETFQAIAKTAKEKDLLVISDEIYDKLIYDGIQFRPFAAQPDMMERTITVNGVSKTYAMTGLRIGYLGCVLPEIVKAVTDIQSQSTSNPNNTAQAAALEALCGPQDEVEKMRLIFERRRDLMLEGVNAIPGLHMEKPGGAFYAFVNCKAIYKGSIQNSGDFARYLLEKHHVACVPGGPFGSEDHIRLSFATDEDTIAKGLERIANACRELS
jgi:aspartate aminotransferase